jgi:NAD(P)-dependent dehydrogenase (short-subunit alcohol dehydrogenase family)
MSGLLENKVCLLTGASSGLGRATALLAAEEGAKLVLGDRDEEGGRETLRQVIDAGGEAVFLTTDVTKADDVEALVGRAIDAHGRIDCAVNNAGIEGERNKTGDYGEAEWRRVIDINLTGVFLCMKYELPEMVKFGGGSIVNIGSTASIGGVSQMPAYVASKHAVWGLTRTTAMDYGEHDIRVNAIFPGSFRTPMSERLFGVDTIEDFVRPLTPMRRLASADEVAETIVWLCSDRASWVSGSGLSVDGAKRAG